MGRPSKYPPEYEARAVELVLETGRPIATVATELGLGNETLRKWVRQAEADAGLVDVPTSAERDELRRLRRENAELKRTNEILKLASAFFAQEADPNRRRS
jgi:transposase